MNTPLQCCSVKEKLLMKCFYNIQLAQDFWHKPDVITIWFGAFITAQICNTINWFQPTDFIKALWHIIFEQRQTGLVTLFSTTCANHTKIIHIDLFNMFSNFFLDVFLSWSTGNFLSSEYNSTRPAILSQGTGLFYFICDSKMTVLEGVLLFLHFTIKLWTKLLHNNWNYTAKF